MADFRTEHDLLGSLEVPSGALYGIHTVRAIGNFPLAQRPLNAGLIHACGAVKLTCAGTNHKLGRTETQDAVLVTLGREMGTYAEAFARGRRRFVGDAQ